MPPKTARGARETVVQCDLGDGFSLTIVRPSGFTVRPTVEAHGLEVVRDAEVEVFLEAALQRPDADLRLAAQVFKVHTRLFNVRLNDSSCSFLVRPGTLAPTPLSSSRLETPEKAEVRPVRSIHAIKFLSEPNCCQHATLALDAAPIRLTMPAPEHANCIGHAFISFGHGQFIRQAGDIGRSVSSIRWKQWMTQDGDVLQEKIRAEYLGEIS